MPEELLLWKQRIKEKNKSGMSVSEWCKINSMIVVYISWSFLSINSGSTSSLTDDGIALNI